MVTSDGKINLAKEKHAAYWLRNANKYLMTVRTLFGSVDNSDLTCAMLVITSSGSTAVTD